MVVGLLLGGNRVEAQTFPASISVAPDLFSGGLSYSIPIEVPAGRNGVQPELALVYQSAAGNGLAGVGWTLNVGAIERSSRYRNNGFMGVDYNSDYYYAMNGAELVFVSADASGREFRDRIEGAFTRIKEIGSYWEATDKMGRRYLFGQTAASRQDGAPGIFKWALDQVIDPNGNYMIFSYLKDQGQLYLDRIDYTYPVQAGAQTNYVKFYYETRPDAPVMYATNFAVTTAKRLKSIDVWGGGTHVRAYQLSYLPGDSVSTKRSILTGVQEFDRNSSVDSITGIVTGGTALPAITIGYNNGANGFTNPTWTVTNSWGGTSTTWAGDFNGDGRSDIASATGGNVYMKLSTGGGFASQTWPVANSWGGTGFNWVGDFNGDGKMDIASGSGANVYMKLSTGSGFTSQTWPVTNSWGSASFTWVGDFNGDGKTDIASASGGNVYMKLSTGSGFTSQTWHVANSWGSAGFTWVGDFNGDGRADIASASGAYVFMSLSMGIEFYSYRWDVANSWGSASLTWVSDFNGDGKTDIASATGGNVYMKLSTGGGFVSQTWPVSNIWNSSGYNWVGDFNGDGKMDIASGNILGGIYAKLSTGSGFINQAWTLGNWGGSGYTKVGDFNGDGKADVASASGANVYVKQSLPAPADFMTSLSNGIGGRTAINYGSSAPYANTQLPFVVQVVTQVSTCDNYTTSCIGTTSTIDYSYAGGYYYLPERDFRGFSTVTVTGPADVNGQRVRTSTYFHQGNDIDVDVNNPSAPVGYMKGKPYRTAVYDGSNQLLSATLTTYGVDTLEPFFNPPTSVMAYTYDGDASYKRTLVNYTYDNTWGDVWREDHYGDADIAGDEYTIERSYFANQALWIVGLPAQETVYKGVNPVSVNPQSQATFYYDGVSDCATASTNQVPTKGNLTRTVRWLKEKPSGATDPETRMAYDSYGNLICSRDGRGNTTTFSYDAATATFPLTVTNPLGHQTRTTYYGVDGVPANTGLYGQVQTVFDANNRSTTTMYDSFGRHMTTSFPNGAWKTTSYMNFGMLDSTDNSQHVYTTTTAGLSSRSFFDGLGRTIRSRTTGPENKIVVKMTTYDGRGQVRTASLPFFDGGTQTAQTFSYDSAGRTIWVDNPDGTTVRSCTQDWTTTAIDAKGHARKEYRDAFGHVIRVEEYTGTNTAASALSYPSCTLSGFTLYATTLYQYDIMGNLTKVTDTKGNITTMRYDTLKRKIGMADPDMGSCGDLSNASFVPAVNYPWYATPCWTYQYDNNGNLLKQRDAKGQEISFSYDASNRILTKTLPAPAVAVVYAYDIGTDGKGRLTSVTDGSGTTTFAYTAMGQVSQTDKTVDSRLYRSTTTYDLAGRVMTVGYPDNTAVMYEYQGTSLNRVYEGATNYAQYAGYNVLSQPATVTYGNGVLTTYTYADPATNCPRSSNYRVCSLRTTKSGSPDYQYKTYSYDDAGNVTAITDALHGSQSFVYDDLNRLTSATLFYGTLTYQYDQIGNLTYNSERGAYTYPTVANSPRPHAVTAVADGLSYTYDANGNMSSSTVGGNVRPLGYDAENHLVSFNLGTSAVAYVYDGDGGRVKRTSSGATPGATLYIGKLFECSIYSGPCNSGGVATSGTKYIFAGGQRIAAKTVGTSEIYYYHTDHLGSTNVVTDAGGVVVETITYRPYGATLGDDGPPANPGLNPNLHHKYTGQEFDTVAGLYYYNSRYYAPSLGRFIQPDSMVPNLRDPQDLNRYSYVNNNPINYTDPTGHWKLRNLLNSVGKVAAWTLAPTSMANYTAFHALPEAYQVRIIQIGSVAGSIACPACAPLIAAAGAMVMADMNGGTTRDILKAGAIGFGTSYAGSALGEQVGGYFGAAGSFGNGAANAVTSGFVSSSLSTLAYGGSWRQALLAGGKSAGINAATFLVFEAVKSSMQSGTKAPQDAPVETNGQSQGAGQTQNDQPVMQVADNGGEFVPDGSSYNAKTDTLSVTYDTGGGIPPGTTVEAKIESFAGERPVDNTMLPAKVGLNGKVTWTFSPNASSNAFRVTPYSIQIEGARIRILEVPPTNID